MMEYITNDNETYVVMDAPSAAEMLGLVPKGSTPPLMVRVERMVDVYKFSFDVPQLDFSRRRAITWEEANRLLLERQKKKKPCICGNRYKAQTAALRHR